MKRSYIKILCFILLNLLILFLNSFVHSILDKYKLIVLLAIDLLVFYKILGFEKDRHRYTKDILLDVLIFLMVYFILYYILGIMIGFVKIENYFTYDGLVKYIFPAIVTIILKELLRYVMLVKIESKKSLQYLLLLLFIFFDISSAIHNGNFTNASSIFKFCALIIMPSVSTNIMCLLLSRNIGYKPLIFYLLVLNLYYYFVPIIPNPSEYLSSIIQFITPLILLFKLYKYIKLEEDESISRNYNKKYVFYLIIPLCIVTVLAYFVSGYFYYEAIAVASGSMYPSISKGDVVIIEKDVNNLKIGNVIAYKYDNIIIVHRLVKIVNSGDETYYYTKGDSNNMIDNYPISIENIIGVVDFKIPYIGIPTVWLNSL